MVGALFGSPIVGGDRLERARKAMSDQNKDYKEDDARKYVDDMKIKYGNGASTKCMIYNATGETVTFDLNHDYHGHIDDKCDYPGDIANGQWGAFLHVHSAGAAVGSSAAVVYHGDGGDWLMSWITPWSSFLYNNYAYAEVRERFHYHTDRWSYIENLIESHGTEFTDRWNGYVCRASIGSGTTVVFKGIMTIANAE